MYHQDIAACFQERVGALGLTAAEYDPLLERTRTGLARIASWRASGELPLFQIPDRRADLDMLEPVAARFRTFDNVIILGTGGSSLGGQALYEMAHPGFEGRRAGIPRMHIVTNIDPFSFESLLDRLDLGRTGVIAISKSGGTAETLMQLLTILPRLRQHVPDRFLRDRVLVITEPGSNPLRRLAERFMVPVLDHDQKVGGRYSVLTLVGMLPAMIAGLEPVLVRLGARDALDQALSAASPGEIPAAQGAAIAVGLNRHHGVNATVMLAYSDRLGSLARWYRQLWAESLGKNGMGTTPIYGTGPVDQHSQLQLWLDGPPDKMFTVLSGPVPETKSRIDPDLATDPDLAYLAGRSLGEMMETMRRATAETLVEHGKPTRLITLERIDETSLGALMMHFMLETILAADLLGVDPFNQPAVEHGKKLARKLLAEWDQG